MLLREWMEAKAMSIQDVADKLGTSYGGVMKWLRSERMPGPLYIQKIRELTNGAVTANDFNRAWIIAERRKAGPQNQRRYDGAPKRSRR